VRERERKKEREREREKERERERERERETLVKYTNIYTFNFISIRFYRWRHKVLIIPE